MHAAGQVALLVIQRSISAAILSLLFSLTVAQNYVDLKGIDNPAEIMMDRPDAPGSAAAAWAEHEDHCWLRAPKDTTTGALIRVHPNDPFIYVSSVEHKRGRLFIHAIEQHFEGKDRGLDTILAFCTERN